MSKLWPTIEDTKVKIEKKIYRKMLKCILSYIFPIATDTVTNTSQGDLKIVTYAYILTILDTEIKNTNIQKRAKKFSIMLIFFAVV